ncbi:Uncharacterized protein RNJ44_00041 [Nakaseomyces bracarensis]|uniref:Translocon Sec61/SecY plug domain-containing protein n=1 Tax=Nakaseomyces bracarensis TaxID=273131 RepID=A0ABR4P108_9SACH
MAIRLIDLARTFLPLIPEVEVPFEKVGFDDKVVYTIFSALIYLFAQFQLVGLPKVDDSQQVNDPLYFLRGVFAAEPRTLLEFGVFPNISSALIMQLLAGLKVIKVNFKVQQDRELFQTLIKIFALFQYFVLANIFIFSGYYGANLSVIQIGLLNLQLCGTGFVTTLICEVIDKGFGFASGTMVINTMAIATNLVSDTFGISQITVDENNNTEPQGSLINLLQGFRAKHRTLIESIISAFNRDYLPNLTTTVIVVAIAAVVCYLQNVVLEVPIRSTRARGMNNIFPIRLLYVGSLSVIFSYVILFYVHIGAFTLIQLIAKNNTESIICKVLGHYEMINNLLAVPTFPLSLLTPPRSLISNLTEQPLTIFTYTLFMVVTGVWFANKWQAISGSSAVDIAAEFKEQGVTLSGRREQSIAKELNKIIPVAARTGAAVLALITVCGELLGLKGKGAGIVVGAAGAFSILELVTLEYQQSGGGSALGQFLGAPAGM